MAIFGILSSVFVSLIIAEVLAEQGCTYTSSSITCSRQSGKFLDVDVSTDINIIYIETCDMSAITREDFKNFPDMDQVYILDTKLSFPKHNRLLSAFRDLHTLTIAKGNMTEEVGSVFEENHHIKKLNIMGNEISVIRIGFVSHLKDVEDIDLSYNKITHIDVGGFDGLQSLKTLNLSHNNIGIHFDPSFLVFAPSKCVVCRDADIRQKCTLNDWKSCLRNEPYDQLWLIPQVVSIHLNANPICDIITGKMRVENLIDNAIENSNRNEGKPQGDCKVYEQGHCFKHEGRRMFLLESCGLRNIPQSNLEQSINYFYNADVSGNDLSDAKTKLSLFSTPIFWFLMALAVLIGVAATMWYQKKEKYRPRYSSTNEPDNSVKLPLIQAEDNSLHQAVIDEDIHQVKALLKSGANSNHMDANGDLPLHYAARSGNIEIVKEILKKTVEVNATNLNGHSAIHAAIARGHRNVVEYLLQHGADCHVKNKYGNSPLSQAAKEGHTEIVRLLCDNGANIHDRNSFQETPVHQAARRGRLDTFKLLHDKGADITVIDGRGFTPLHYVAKNGNIEIARLILDGGESVNVCNVSQNTPLHKAAKSGRLEMIKFLLQRGADIRATNFKGRKPNEVAEEYKHPECKKFLDDELKSQTSARSDTAYN